MASANPFALPDEGDINDNPFADSSATQASPYAFNSYSASTSEPAYASAAYAQPAQATSASFAAKEEELRRREEDLNAREAALKRDQEAMRAAGFQPPNWPKFYPLFHHDIEGDIPEPSRRLVRNIYRLWFSTIGVLVLNMAACLALLISHPDSLPNVASDFGVSLFSIPFIGAGSLYLWYRPVYMAFQKNAGIYFYTFLLFNGIHILYASYMAIGIPASGGAGVINLLAALANGKLVAGIFCIAATAGWVLNALYSVWLWKDVHASNRAAGHTLQSARNEAAVIGVQSGAAQTAANAYMRSDTGHFGA
ncbi:scamp family-domain-containing protein [Fimicolochytrium jonesii]|uniref:scamp family-domain-containing protein n=1 Tax=Fimicolochytrium jonesii TaxID=1396493 RepID=UPI0022FE64F9|nr:scamp family-domain-containing protein [Fimicolochytrium jonesii]KAI8820630.1 scamp family-domain-containing protein [Fimicolochytrium jonesii]